MNNHVFRSMTDLIYFFEFLNKNPELIDKFVDDIEDLIGLRSDEEQYTGTNIKYQNFTRLIKSILGYSGHEHDENVKFYFQRHIMRVMQNLVSVRVGALTNRDKYYAATDKGRSEIVDAVYQVATYVDYYAKVFPGRELREPSRIIE